jgi:low density lipoprotein receptor-related protein 5/6
VTNFSHRRFYSSSIRRFYTDCRYIYWSNSVSSGPRIERATLDGRGRRTIVSKDLGQVSSLTIDYTGHRLYWVSVDRACVEMSDMLGMSRQLLISKLQQPFGVALYGDHIFWTDWTTRTIERANKMTGAERSIVRSRVDFPMDLAAFHASRQQGTGAHLDTLIADTVFFQPTASPIM